MKELERQKRNIKDKEKVPQMTREMEGQMHSQDIVGTIKEVRQVYRSPAQIEKGKEYDGDDTHPEETSIVELHVAIE